MSIGILYIDCVVPSYVGPGAIFRVVSRTQPMAMADAVVFGFRWLSITDRSLARIFLLVSLRDFGSGASAAPW